ncbi:MAG: RNA-binding protein, partial [Nitrososphaerota archaeon]
KTGAYFTPKLQSLPVTVTFGLIKDKLIVDPHLEEESVLDVSIIIGVDEKDNIVSIQKNSPGLIPEHLLTKMIEIAIEKAREIRKIFCEKLNISLD